MRELTVLFGVFFGVVALGANIAVIDSGTDYKHVDLKTNMWQSDSSTVTDADGKKYEDIQHGWNFAENNNQVIDYKYLGTFSADCNQLFVIQAKILTGKASSEEKNWYNAKKADANFVKELSKFGNFVHGTHVSGISAREVAEARIMALKLIPTESPVGSLRREAEAFMRGQPNAGADNPLAQFFLKMLAQRQAELLVTVGKFVGAAKADVANGSFGTSVKAVAPILAGVLKNILGHEPSEEEKQAYAEFFVREIITASQAFTDAAKNTLFVFAAGNDGTDNDKLPVSPANIKQANTIAVAATNGLTALASFSNYGATLVEVAAPGVAIEAPIPGDERLLMSGTSMAAPFVTNVAGAVADANNDLAPAAIKKILMDTVDKKDFLAGKVVSGGIVNKDRAVRAAQLSRSNSLEAAVRQARAEVRDAVDSRNVRVNEKDLIVLPLPSTL